MARRLQDRLALASYKTKHGMDTMSFSLVEAHIDNHLKHKRLGSSVISSSDSSSSTSSDNPYLSRGFNSSPISAPVFSDDIYDPNDHAGSRKRARFHTAFPDSINTASSKPRRSYSMAPPTLEDTHQSWRSMHSLVDSSPLQNRIHPDFRTANGPNISFVSESSTIPNSPPFGGSDDDELELPAHSFHRNISTLQSSLPRTPPPTRSRGARNRKGNATGEEGAADLLLYLATSPSPAKPSTKARNPPPCTPPSNHAVLPSSMMATPGGTNIFTGFSTPGQQFNFADFVNITPSPAQGAFGSHTPIVPKTPLAAKEARRRLNFDNLVPPSASPVLSNVGRGSVNTGLGMELGGELVS